MSTFFNRLRPIAGSCRTGSVSDSCGASTPEKLWLCAVNVLLVPRMPQEYLMVTLGSSPYARIVPVTLFYGL